MIYVQFYEQRNGSLVEPCGSDQVFILDGRNKIETWINDGFERMHKLRHVQPYYCAFRIFKGEKFSNSKQISDYYYKG